MRKSFTNHPEMGKVYSLETIERSLELTDTPFLRFKWNEEIECIQTSHINQDQLLSVPDFANTIWRYECTTREEIPLFMYVDDRPITDFVDIEDNTSEYSEGKWVTPKGFPREQYPLNLT